MGEELAWNFPPRVLLDLNLIIIEPNPIRTTAPRYTTVYSTCFLCSLHRAVHTGAFLFQRTAACGGAAIARGKSCARGEMAARHGCHRLYSTSSQEFVYC